MLHFTSMLHLADLPGTVWRKSSRSDQQGACVEVSRVGLTHAVRDSKNPDGDALAVAARAWKALIARIKRGDLDL